MIVTAEREARPRTARDPVSPPSAPRASAVRPLRRLFVHESLYDKLVPALKKTYANLPIGNPLDTGTLVGPLIDRQAFENMKSRACERESGRRHRHTGGGRALADKFADGYYVQPAIVEMPSQTSTVCHETFAPILYVMKYTDFDTAMAKHNEVPQGLSSCIFTTNMQEAEKFIAAAGSDCGIANVNIGPSGAEIGGAFGGEKETGGGRESGSDSWRAYMRRQTATNQLLRRAPRWRRGSSSPSERPLCHTAKKGARRRPFAFRDE